MNAPVQRSLLSPITAQQAFAEMRAILAAAEQQEREKKQRTALARKVALSDLIEARAE